MSEHPTENENLNMTFAAIIEENSWFFCEKCEFKKTLKKV